MQAIRAECQMSVKGLLISLQVQYTRVFASIALHERIKSCKLDQFYNLKWLACQERKKKKKLSF